MFGFLKRCSRKSSNEAFDVAPIVQQMFDEAGIRPQCPDKNVFLTVIDGVHCSFNTVLRCDEEESRKLFVYAQFPIPVLKHVANLVVYEIERLNKSAGTARIALQEGADGYSIFAYTDHAFDRKPALADIKNLMIHTIDVIDNANFRSIACAIMGYAAYSELEKAMLNNAAVSGNNATIRMQDGYCELNDKVSGISSVRYTGRLIKFSTHIMESNGYVVYEEQISWKDIVQTAYELANDKERDVIRKLSYLRAYLVTDEENEMDFIFGRMETEELMKKDIYSLLT